MNNLSYSCLSFVERDDSSIQDDQFIHILRRTDVCVKMYCQLPAAAQQAACVVRASAHSLTDTTVTSVAAQSIAAKPASALVSFLSTCR